MVLIADAAEREDEVVEVAAIQMTQEVKVKNNFVETFKKLFYLDGPSPNPDAEDADSTNLRLTNVKKYNKRKQKKADS